MPGHLLPGANGGPQGTGTAAAGPPGSSGGGAGGGGLTGHVSVADAIASLEGGKGATYSGELYVVYTRALSCSVCVGLGDQQQLCGLWSRRYMSAGRCMED